MKNKRLKILLIIFPITLVLAVIVNYYLYTQNNDRMLLEEFELDGYTIRTLKFWEDDDRLRGLCAVYWKMEKDKRIALKKADIDKILEANAKGCWTIVQNDDAFIKFTHKDGHSKAMYDKENKKLSLFSADFMGWCKRKDFSKRDMDIFNSMVE